MSNKKRSHIKLTITPYQDKKITERVGDKSRGAATVVSDILDQVIKGTLRFPDGRNYFD
ncbi:hypothetical protein QNI19_26750 [Cytophagaceae bacterium DM2B3-1]|uniref:Uncharacterized protein n=1 Tax=Xanthocytophaga flava TaxID=3048013 RepID=A0ABT7CS29_9BACT|nr:hypothetical protein [Xanthocytophaga flavus]MDJ1496561.1 hypothetical protein [Xanthocytophaga flavus]